LCRNWPVMHINFQKVIKHNYKHNAISFV
jgi:hypothetical protein